MKGLCDCHKCQNATILCKCGKVALLSEGQWLCSILSYESYQSLFCTDLYCVKHQSIALASASVTWNIRILHNPVVYVKLLLALLLQILLVYNMFGAFMVLYTFKAETCVTVLHIPLSILRSCHANTAVSVLLPHSAFTHTSMRGRRSVCVCVYQGRCACQIANLLNESTAHPVKDFITVVNVFS